MLPDPTMEVLCLLPRKPFSAHRRDICHDTGLTDSQAMTAIAELNRIGICAETVSRKVCIVQRDWRKAQALGFAYLDQLEKASIAG